MYFALARFLWAELSWRGYVLNKDKLLPRQCWRKTPRAIAHRAAPRECADV
jgi:hypothetical protein